MEDEIREQFNIFFKHILKGDRMETTNKDEATTGQKAIVWLRSVRIAFDARIKFFATYKELAGSQRYMALAVTAIERARLFMGKLMGAYGSANPYTKGYDPSSPEVLSPVDTYDAGELPTVHEGQQIVHIKQARKDLATVIKGLEGYLTHFPSDSNGKIFLTQVIVSLHDATNWLGMELFCLKEKLAPPAEEVNVDDLPKG